MSIISWNCRGLGNLSSVPKFKYLIRYYNPDAIFLCETLVHRNKIEELRILLGFENCFAVDREGRGGSVALLWKSTIHCNITNYSSNHINVEIDDAHRGTWRLTGFYGYPGGSRRRDSWNFLRRLSQSSQLPWCIIGDFNDILDAIEKKGRSERPNWLINGFRQAVLDSGLSDVHMDGYPFTWFKSLGTPRAVEERLDRALANEAWFQLFPNAKLENLVAPASDHYPILLDRDPIIRSCRARRKFKFENAWCIETELDDVVHRSWLSTLERPIMPRLEVCAEDLSQWSKNHCHNFKKEIEDCRKKLQQARDQGSVSNANYVNALRKRMTHLLVQDDLFWRQRAKNHWYRDGDLNTRFFHASATSRRKVNRISYLKDDSGLRTTDISGMCNLAKNYFDELFQKQASTRGPVISTIMPTIFDDDNEKLTSPFKIEEFKEALFSMHSDKCPGPDGFNPGFYQHFWNLCSQDIFHECCSWLHSGQFPPTLNMTNISLIPKGEVQSTMKDWRPIALCNVLYKLVSKVLANRLKRVLDKCISDNQSAFVPDRSILDNAMVAIEVVHFLKSKTRGKLGNVALKLDISKAYDRIDWDYLKEVMIKMGFSHQWVKWVMMCVESVDYSVIVNDDMVGPIIPGRGLRQGDPLSPYLFIICAEGLSSLIKQAEARGDIHGIKICKNAPIISHLLFADDCFLFFRADEHEAYIMKNILSTYEAASGQAISFPKSEIFCSRNVPQVVQNSITNILGVQAVLGTGKYLGLPSMVGRSKKETFNYIKDRVWRKINSWSSKCLSKAGREVLIKSVLQAIPSYVMSIFLIPGSLIDAIEKMMNSFWWGHGGSNNKGIHLLAWDKLSVHKNKGGMGFKDLTAFNIAMLGKQGWKFQSSPNSLVSRLFKARYFPHSNFLASSLGHNPSYVWRSISSAKFLVRAGARWCIDSGENISILGEPWIQGGTLISASNPSVMHLQNIKVKHLISNTTKEWDSHVINNIFDQGTADAILRTPLFQQVTSDKLVWKAEKKGNYTVKSAYRLCVEELLDTSHLSRPGFWSGIWRLKVPPKVKNLLWRICRGCFPTRARLRDNGIQCPSNCVVCDDNYEDTGHILFDCPLSIRAWRSIGLWEKVEAAVKTTTTAATSIFLLLQQLDEQQATHMAALIVEAATRGYSV
ncbi:unnamed protein product [Trifolium pratense]|uniref:Uncharacterized protein n=1 Tax=Trifolium pratense TaxID=57577 RepID=A0ACB0K835_TRIPR|nr:unnamed protein product [Trifolium pratense]